MPRIGPAQTTISGCGFIARSVREMVSGSSTTLRTVPPVASLQPRAQVREPPASQPRTKQRERDQQDSIELIWSVHQTVTFRVDSLRFAGSHAQLVDFLASGRC